MEQIIVDVKGLSAEEKQRINEALEKITGVTKLQAINPKAGCLFAPDSQGLPRVAWSWLPAYGEATHTPEEVLEMAGMAKQGHIHAENMALYAEDAKTTDKPWKLWQVRDSGGEWRDFACNPNFATYLEFRRKPKTHTVHGVEVPDLRFNPKNGEEYWFPDVSTEKLVHGTVCGYGLTIDTHRVSNNLCYKPTDEGKQAAILHAKAMLGIN